MDLTSHPSQTAVFIKLFPGLARIQFQHVGIPTRDLDWMWGRIQFKRLSGLMMQVSDGFLVWSSIFCSGWRISFQNVYMGWLLPTSVTSVGEYMGLGDGCCQHPSPLLVNTWNTWAWVTDVANIHHLCWWIHGIHGLGWRILPTSVTSVGEYVGLGDGCCQHPSPLLVKHCLGDGFCRHPSPLLVNTWNTWAWVTDAGSIRHLVWSNIAWVTDFADYFVCVCVFLQVFDVESIRRGDGLGWRPAPRILRWRMASLAWKWHAFTVSVAQENESVLKMEHESMTIHHTSMTI